MRVAGVYLQLLRGVVAAAPACPACAVRPACPALLAKQVLQAEQ